MKQRLIYFGSVLSSTLLFILVLSFAGVLGPIGVVAATTTMKVLGWIILYFLMVRIPIALIKANETRKINKTRAAMNKEAEAAIARAAVNAAKDTIKIKLPTVDNPITPMPIDSDLE